MEIEVILTPAEITGLPRRDLSATTCVVFDVLRATSTILTALASGARRVYPVSTVEEALALKSGALPDALLGGERGGVRIDGFDLGNSPSEYGPAVVAGRDLISTTTNGTVAFRACAAAKAVSAGAWLNLDALVTWVRTLELTTAHLMLVCAGTGEDFALEDGYAVGGLLARLVRTVARGSQASTERFSLTDASSALLNMYERRPDDALGALQASTNGRRLKAIGLDGDVQRCAATTALPWVGTMRRGAIEGERIKPGT